jgi:hypothetical protein
LRPQASVDECYPDYLAECVGSVQVISPQPFYWSQW